MDDILKNIIHEATEYTQATLRAEAIVRVKDAAAVYVEWLTKQRFLKYHGTELDDKGRVALAQAARDFTLEVEHYKRVHEYLAGSDNAAELDDILRSLMACVTGED